MHQPSASTAPSGREYREQSACPAASELESRCHPADKTLPNRRKSRKDGELEESQRSAWKHSQIRRMGTEGPDTLNAFRRERVINILR